ncbi:hypothetical protein C6P08_06950 [Weissella confusa]|uniref:ImmA/IrrE family metallo-endopeptidase n=1 Tax=Weissella TaxID=46255 RepID=UPI00109203D7|nr:MULTISPECIES: ImmA/IrrE family metallo-endopeptidase [Weissella]MBJ7694304.1 ImmA/IrrE family metallo-endopeptidase [Weissella confusa]NFA03603.1 ImmA/IrrE family metallo-endopeptidase [Weissella cibaria]QBZ04934.1 hypothetical protein C6P08_06950 [Weissella confusa]
MIKILAGAVEQTGYNVYALCEKFGVDIVPINLPESQLGAASPETNTLFVNSSLLGRPLGRFVIAHGLVHLLHHKSDFFFMNADLADSSLLDRDATLTACEIAVRMYNKDKCNCMSCDATSVLSYFELPECFYGDVQRAILDFHQENKK